MLKPIAALLVGAAVLTACASVPDSSGRSRASQIRPAHQLAPAPARTRVLKRPRRAKAVLRRMHTGSAQAKPNAVIPTSAATDPETWDKAGRWWLH